MKKNVFYKDQFARSSALKKNVAAAIYLLLSLPKLVLDVFLRKNMGERYYNAQSAILVGLLLLLPPFFISTHYETQKSEVFLHNIPYFTFLAVYAFLSYRRYKEVKRLPSVYDFARFSLSQGQPHDFLVNICKGNFRTLQLYIEPLTFLLPGLLFFLIGWYALALVVILCALCYSVSNFVAFRQSDHFMMDKIDEMICNKELSGIFTLGQDISPSGIPFYAKKPTTAALREELADFITNYDNDDDGEVR